MVRLHPLRLRAGDVRLPDQCNSWRHKLALYARDATRDGNHASVRGTPSANNSPARAGWLLGYRLVRFQSRALISVRWCNGSTLYMVAYKLAPWAGQDDCSRLLSERWRFDSFSHRSPIGSFLSGCRRRASNLGVDTLSASSSAGRAPLIFGSFRCHKLALLGRPDNGYRLSSRWSQVRILPGTLERVG